MSRSKPIVFALIELLCFLEFCNDEGLDPDLAIAQMEQAGAILQESEASTKAEFLEACQDYAKMAKDNSPEKREFIQSLPETLGLTE